MADVIRKATNRFTKGLVMDFSPENTKNELLTNALNATLLTFNGNELSLLNDMGNGRVETAYLPDGYMPVGTCEYGGIIYIVSYNPLEDKSLIGCFPSPERNISSDELGLENKYIDKTAFQQYNKGILTGDIKHNTQYVLLKNDNLNPGDKFIVCSEKSIYNEKLADLYIDKDSSGKEFKPISNPIIALNVVSIEDSGKIVYLNSDIKQYEVTNSYNVEGEQHTDTYKYHILGKMMEGTNLVSKDDLDSYRDVLSSGYSVFKSKTSGKLAILAELIMIDSYSVTHSIEPRVEDGQILEGMFDIIIHTEVSPEINIKNYNLVPKLHYYYLLNSLGYILIEGNLTDNTTITLFNIKEENGEKVVQVNNNFYNTKLSQIYEPIDSSINLNSTLGESGKFNFPKPFTYHSRLDLYNGDISGTTDKAVYTKFTEGKYHRIDKSQIKGKESYFTDTVKAKFYYYNPEGEEYVKYENKEIDLSYTYYIRKDDHIYHDAKRSEEHKNKILYKLITSPIAASEKEVKDKTIEKFLYQEIHTYYKATPEDLKNSDKLFYIDEELKYVLLTGSPKDGVLYYTLTIERNLVSIGYEIKDNVVQGAIYYYPSTKTYEIASQEERDKYYDFNTYPLTEKEPYGSPITLYWKLDNYKYIEATENQIVNREELNIQLFYSTNYLLITRIDLLDSMTYQIFIVVPIDTFIGKENFEPNPSYNYFNGKKPNDIIYPKDDELLLFTISNFIPSNIDEDINFDELSEEEKKKYFNYQDVKLANIKLPSVVSVNGLDLPFKYDYTIVPCMNYGRLDHLAVSNTVDFSKLHAFNQSDFNIWKYYIEDNLLRLTFGANIYDTYEENKVDALVLEFYDCWGFAGSLEIVDKKSYSGIFTKIIPLNAIKALSLKKIIGNEYTTNFARNINIKEVYDKDGNLKEDEFIYSGKSVEYNKDNPTIGWRQKDRVKPEEDVIVLNNDCGTLYSNLLYGVKAYLRIGLKDGGKKFIKKKEFFLYTLPIYNDYYYTLNDFSNLENPELDLMLTYKIKDNSNRIDYNEGNIINGYNPLDKENVDKYLDGFSDKRQFDLVKYYKYIGTSELYLEIGLKKDYESLNVSYNPNINLYFNGKLKLLSDDNSNETFTVNSGVDGISNISQILNYHRGDTIIDPSVNKLLFSGQNIELPIGGIDFKETNFINYIGTKPVKIEYEFVVGYTATINEIRTTLVQATTLCALFHKKPSGEYNYEDFGIYEQSSGESSELLSNIMFYNEGTSEKEIFGICRQITTDSTKNLMEQCAIITSVESDAIEIKTAGKLNSGNPLQQLVGNIGKLTFCQPHVHGFSEINGASIHGGRSNNLYAIPAGTDKLYIHDSASEDGSKKYDNCSGINPDTIMFDKPLYNLCVNTKNSILYNSEFISTIDWETFNGDVLLVNTNIGNFKWQDKQFMRSYTGFTGKQIATFNQKMIETMKHVYAYNPDYDSLTVNVGNITLQNYNPYFTSNLLNILSTLAFQNNLTLNDFIYLGPIIFTNYLKYLSNNSKSSEEDSITIYKKDEPTSVLNQIQLIPNFNYCGTPENWYLISPLTYNTPVPRDLELELEFSASDIIVIKHTDGHNTFLEGNPNKKTLYSYNSEFKKMILLDVSNYTIDSDGVLKLNNEGSRKLISSEVEITTDMHLDIVRGNCYYSTNLKTEDGDIPVTINIKLGMNGMGVLYEQLIRNLEYLLIGLEQPIYDQNEFSIKPELSISSSNDKYTYSIKPTEIELECEYKTLNEKTVLFDSNYVYDSDTILLRAQSYETLMDLVSSTVKTTNFVNILGLPIVNRENNYYWSSPNSFDMRLFINNKIFNNETNTLLLSQNGDLQFKIESRIGVPNRNYTLGILKLRFKKLKFEITQISKLETTLESFIHTSRTVKYSDFKDNKYEVNDAYKKTRLRGSSITINDLVYEPNLDGHRLFIKNNLHVYNSYLRGKVYYRFLNNYNGESGFQDGKHDSWHKDTKYLNSIFLFTGPCYTSDNLNYNETIDG